MNAYLLEKPTFPLSFFPPDAFAKGAENPSSQKSINLPCTCWWKSYQDYGLNISSLGKGRNAINLCELKYTFFFINLLL